MEARRVAVAVLLAVTVGGCKGSRNDGKPPGDGRPPDGSDGGVAIGPAGGTVSGDHGASVTIPAGALEGIVIVSVARTDAGAPAPSPGFAAAGAPYALTPHGTRFSAPVTVRIPFDADLPTDADPTLWKAEPGGAFTTIASAVDGGDLVAQVTDFSWVIPATSTTRPRMVYAIDYGGGTPGVASFRITRATGALSAATSKAPVGEVPMSVAVHPSGRFAFVTHTGAATVNGIPPNSVSAYVLDARTGAVSGPVSTQALGGHPIVSVVHPTGRFIYVVDESRFGTTTGGLSVLSVDPVTGTLGAPVTTAASGGSPATAVAFSPSGRRAYVTYMSALGVSDGYGNQLMTFDVDPTTGALVGPVGSGWTQDSPWSLAVSPDGRYAYVALLGYDMVSVYELDPNGNNFHRSSQTVSKAAAVAVDPFGRFLYVAGQNPAYNVNLKVYQLRGSSLTWVGSWIIGEGSEVGPVFLAADPQGEFLYATDPGFGDAALVSFAVAADGMLTRTGRVAGATVGGGTLGVGDPSGFAVSGTSPVWVNGCSALSDDRFTFDGCYVGSGDPTRGAGGTGIGRGFLQVIGGACSGPGSSAGGGGGSAGPPARTSSGPALASATTHVLTVHQDPVWGGDIWDDSRTIDYSTQDLGRGKWIASFPTGATVVLHELPQRLPVQGYDVHWTPGAMGGGCTGTATSTTVVMDRDVDCYLHLTPVSTR